MLDVITHVGSGSNLTVLKDAGVADADLFIAATAIDEVNMVACFLAKQIGVRRTVARIRETSIATRSSSMARKSKARRTYEESASIFRSPPSR